MSKSLDSEMTLKEECEILRGEKITEKRSVEDIPCIETSDKAKLCSKPLVSVVMTTYNHEPYIREAIEGVVFQETDFEYELLIGEDCSTDKTREIVFEYQKKYPEKIRILWSEKNEYAAGGGNFVRTYARARGDFIAYCEGDDYWIDKHKLQKQIDIFKANHTVGLVATSAFVRNGTAEELVRVKSLSVQTQFIPRDCVRKKILQWAWTISTPSVMHRRNLGYELEIQKYYLSLGDTTKWLSVAEKWDFYTLTDATVVYRLNPSSLTHTVNDSVNRDGAVVRHWFAGHWGMKTPQTITLFQAVKSVDGRNISGIRAAFKLNLFCKVALWLYENGHQKTFKFLMKKTRTIVKRFGCK